MGRHIISSVVFMFCITTMQGCMVDKPDWLEPMLDGPDISGEVWKESERLKLKDDEEIKRRWLKCRNDEDALKALEIAVKGRTGLGEFFTQYLTNDNYPNAARMLRFCGGTADNYTLWKLYNEAKTQTARYTAFSNLASNGGVTYEEALQAYKSAKGEDLKRLALTEMVTQNKESALEHVLGALKTASPTRRRALYLLTEEYAGYKRAVPYVYPLLDSADTGVSLSARHTLDSLAGYDNTRNIQNTPKAWAKWYKENSGE